MKISRLKKVHKCLNFFVNNYGFREPYQILIDGTYCFAALKNQHNIQDHLPGYFQKQLKFLTTPCVIMETEKLGKKLFGVMIIIKQFGIHKCAHTLKPLSGSECIKSMIGKQNSNRYIVATQDRELQEYLRNIPGLPLLYLHQKTPVLEQPSPTSISVSKRNMDLRFDVNQFEGEKISTLKLENGIEEKNEIKKRKKRKGGPNPLSCKKKKKSTLQINCVTSNSLNKRKHNRKKNKIPNHIKEALLKQAQ